MKSIRRTDYGRFTWIDICNPQTEEINQVAAEFRLETYQISDSLLTGHLPKWEQMPEYQFAIFRAYTAETADDITNVNELSNKIAFFYNSERIITVHRADFSFLHDVPTSFDNAEGLLIYIIRKKLVMQLYLV